MANALQEPTRKGNLWFECTCIHRFYIYKINKGKDSDNHGDLLEDIYEMILSYIFETKTSRMDEKTTILQQLAPSPNINTDSSQINK
jgi:predicted site-specific integrase-resolvase